jgi:hypothetical protein
VESEDAQRGISGALERSPVCSRTFLPSRRVGIPVPLGWRMGKGKERGTGSIDAHFEGARLHGDNNSARAW